MGRRLVAPKAQPDPSLDDRGLTCRSGRPDHRAPAAIVGLSWDEAPNFGR